MVFLSRLLRTASWIDSLRVYVRGGHGGNGLPQVGGVGGKGGSVYIVPSSRVKDLYQVFVKDFKRSSKSQKLIAGSGDHAARSKILGEPGTNIELEVPLGVQILGEKSRVLADLNHENVRVKVASGGEGGGPSNGWIGQPGQSRHIRLDLKIIADIGFVGFPNAGKSTLLKAVSRANPKIAAYPFTTVKPNLGKIFYEDDLREITAADLPGLIEGASYNVGMGHRFLKHAERTRILLFIVDINGFAWHEQGPRRTAFETIVLLNKELELYNPDLVRKPCYCVVNKMDLKDSQAEFEEFRSKLENYQVSVKRDCKDEDACLPERLLQFRDIIPISAKYSPKSVSELKSKLRSWIDETSSTGFKSEDVISLELDAKLRDR